MRLRTIWLYCDLFTAAESDSLALQNIPADLQDLFMERPSKFDRKLEPDHRAELFMEWVEEHPAEVQAWQAERFELSDFELARMEREAFEEQREAVPF